MNEVRAGMLLLATPVMDDPNFADSVVLLLDVRDDGALGVVLNRPSGLAVAEVLGPWADLVAEPEVLFAGGPVETDGALAVALRRTPDDDPTGESTGISDEDPGDLPTDDDSGVHTWSGDAVGFRKVIGRLALLDLDTPVELVRDDLDGLRIFAGYAGWGAEQLQREIAEGHWYVVPGEVPDVFRLDTTDLWRDVLRRQPGDLALHSTRPSDPQLN